MALNVLVKSLFELAAKLQASTKAAAGLDDDSAAITSQVKQLEENLGLKTSFWVRECHAILT